MVLADPSAASPSSNGRLMGASEPFAPPHGGATPARVVHVVGRMTDAVFNFLGPTTAALAAGGARQILLTCDSPELAYWLPRLHPAVEVVKVPFSRSPISRWGRLGARFQAVVAQVEPSTVHLHGLMPSMIGAPLVNRLAREGCKVYMSPHSSKSLRSLSWVGRPVFWLMGSTLARQAQSAIANVPFDVRALSRLSSQPVNLIESPVADVFFTVSRSRTARSPLVIGSGLAEGTDNVPNFAQLATLLSGEDLGLSFNWIAPAAAHDLAPLEAAEVGVFANADEQGRAERLAAGWVYVAAGSTRGFPLPLAEAMAVGLPCVALDLEAHRDMIRHGETGVLCADMPALMRAVAQLIAAPELREQLGTAAREEALRRFRSADFGRRVYEAYAQSALGTPSRSPALASQRAIQP